jgi:hypothetical protein
MLCRPGGNLPGQLRLQADHPRDVGRIGRPRDVADDDLVDRRGIDVGALDGLADHDAAQIDRVQLRQQRPGLDERGADPADDDHVAIGDHFPSCSRLMP